jgi:PAS domain S-box-containing protein
VLPLLLWLVARCQPAFGIAGAFIASGAVIFATTFGLGHFGDAAFPILERVKGAQVATTMVTLYTLVLQSDAFVGSDELFRIYGFDPATPPVDFRREFGRRYSADDLKRLKAAALRAMQTGVGYELDLRAFRNGTPIWLTARAEVVRNGAGQIVGLRGTVQDVTERERAEVLIEESKTCLADALSAGQVIAFEWDALTRVSQRSDNAGDILGSNHDGLAGSIRKDFLRHVHPDDRTSLKTRIHQLRPWNPSYALTFRFIRSDSRLVWLEETAKGEFDATGRLLRIKGLTQDITERKLAEFARVERNLLLALVGTVGRVGSYAYDVSAEKLQVSAGYAALHGLPEGTTETTLNKWRARVHPEDLGRAEGVHDQAVADKRREYSVEYRIVRSDGEVRWIERRCLISYGGDRHLHRVVGVSIDVTERRRTE